MNSNAGSTISGTEPECPTSRNTEGYRYDGTFYRYIELGSLRSASVIVPLVLRELLPRSVIDVGCGAGAWLSEYRNRGIEDCLGLDGAYVLQAGLLIDAEHFLALDVVKDFDVGRRFDLVQCLEVGEHLPEDSSRTLVENLTRHGDRVLFSAATPGQGGENHINEKSHEFWRRLFEEYGYKPFDPIRPMIKGNAMVESWYRRNIILYVAKGAFADLPPSVLGTEIADDRAIPEVSSFAYRLRARVVSTLPMWLVSKIALVKHKLVVAHRRFRSR